ncbi:MAG: hypothetical protein HY401_08045 [Elusimicrobia bacterium]|nr:hypothetical protein [Elusimicrobiota bacterium]
MVTTGAAGPSKSFRIIEADRCFRMKPEALPNHAPAIPGIYEFVTFDDQQNAKVLFVAWSGPLSIANCLEEHLSGRRQPAVAELLKTHGNLYFDFVLLQGKPPQEDWQDVLWALAQQHKPPYNDPNAIAHSNRFSTIELTPINSSA